MEKTNIYILKLKGGKYYVGKSIDPVERFAEHLRGEGSSWTKKHKPIEIMKVIENVSSFDEDKHVKELMSKYGINNVRGGSYVTPELNEIQEISLKKEIWSAKDCCSRCGRSGHWISDCFATTDVDGQEIFELVEDSEEDSEEEIPRFKKSKDIKCYKCGKIGHYASNCYVESDSSEEESYYVKKSSSKTIVCYKCGNFGHYSSSCYVGNYKKKSYY
jgi:predicted GIY-YIG superfamily endonuclease